MTVVLNRLQSSQGADLDTIRALCHDLRQPLAAIMLLAGTDKGDVRRKLEGITEQAHWLAELVDAVLTDASTDEAVPLDVAELAAVAVLRAEPTADCEICLEVPLTEAEAWGRPVALSRALGCVLDNAVRAAGPQGHVTVQVELDAEEVHLLVKDDGPGLGKVPARTSLGLTTTRALVASCEGSFRLRPGPSRGVVADISLGRADIQSAAS